MKQRTITSGGNSLAITVWKNPQYNKTLLIAPAIGVSRHFYKRIAEHFYRRSYNVLTFDYSLDRNPLRLADWGYQDVTAAIDYAHQQLNGQAIYFLGHSMAGQLLPLAENCNRLTAACLVGSQSADKRNWSGWARMKVNLFWHFIIPSSTPIFGKLPGWTYGGTHLPAPIAREWRRWALTRGGLLGALPEAIVKYQAVEVPTKFISFSDDDIAPKKAATAIFESYGSSVKTHEHLTPHQFGIRTIGHFNFFRRQFSFLWPRASEWFDTLSSKTKP